jgi:hypothetical protein
LIKGKSEGMIIKLKELKIERRKYWSIVCDRRFFPIPKT